MTNCCKSKILLCTCLYYTNVHLEVDLTFAIQELTLAFA